jgi:hypothetical protein
MGTLPAFKPSREELELLKAIDRAPSNSAKTIVRNRAELSTHKELTAIANSLGISVAELSGDIIGAKTMNGIVPNSKKSKREFEAGYSAMDSRERRSIVKGIILAEHATRPDYRMARELLNSIGRDNGAVVSSFPDSTVKVFAVKRAIDPERAIQRSEREKAIVDSLVTHIETTEKAIAKNKLKVPTALKRELAKAEDALKAAKARFEKAELSVKNSEAPTADGMRLEFVDEFDIEEMPGDDAIESLELPLAIVRRPFKEYMRPRIRRSPVSPVECEVLRNESDKEWAEFQRQMTEYITVELATKAHASNEVRIQKNAEYKMQQSIAMRNRRNANRRGER